MDFGIVEPLFAHDVASDRSEQGGKTSTDLEVVRRYRNHGDGIWSCAPKPLCTPRRNYDRMADSNANGGPGPKPKVARLIEKYGLEGVGADLEARWTCDEDRESLRSLADWFNERLVRAALLEAGIDTIGEDAGHLYDLLRGETGSRGERTQVERRLERAGVDVETLTDELVSYGAIRTYLTGYRDATPPSDDDGDADTDRENVARTIEGLRQRTVSVTESKLERLRETDRLEVGPHRVLADVQVLCEACGKQYDVADLLESGACDCFESAAEQ